MFRMLMDLILTKSMLQGLSIHEIEQGGSKTENIKLIHMHRRQLRRGTSCFKKKQEEIFREIMPITEKKIIP
jgi:hypothetical protein